MNADREKPSTDRSPFDLASRQDSHWQKKLEEESFPLSARRYRFGDRGEQEEQEWDLPPNLVEPGNFEHEAQSIILKGEPGKSAFVFYGGLASTGFPWKPLAEHFHSKWENHVEVHSLLGHDGDMRSLRPVKHRDWIDDIIEKVERAHLETGGPVVFFGFSTSALAVVEAVRRRPELFAGVVLVGAPLKLRNKTHGALLRGISILERLIPGGRFLTQQITVPISHRKSNQKYHPHYQLSPRMPKVPLSTLTSLSRLQKAVQKSLESIECPTLILQGTDDRFATETHSDEMYRRIQSQIKDIAIFEGSPHPVMLSQHASEFANLASNWLEELERKGLLTLSEPEDPRSAPFRSWMDALQSFFQPKRDK